MKDIIFPNEKRNTRDPITGYTLENICTIRIDYKIIEIFLVCERITTAKNHQHKIDLHSEEFNFLNKNIC